MPSLTDFVGSLPDELLLCPVRALRIFLRRTSSLSLRPRSLFVSPRCPSRALSKNAWSYFLCSVILQSLFSAPPASVPSSASLSHSGSSPSPSTSSASSSFRVHSVRAMATSTAFARNVLVPTLLEAATWRPASVFTSFYLQDVQFESARGFSLGLVVATGAVV